MSCKQAGHAEELLASINAPTTPSTRAAAELTEQIGGLLEPTRQLVSALEQTHEQLTCEAKAARQERDDAIATAAEERGLREIAECRAKEAQRHADECIEATRGATEEGERAEARAREADTARQHAEQRQLRAEARAEELVETLRRTDERLQAATGYTEDLDRQLAGASAQVSELRERLDEERERSEAERVRADALATDHQRQVEQLRTSAAARDTELRRDHDRERTALAERQEAAIAELHERLGRGDQQLADERRQAAGLRARLDRWWHELGDLVRLTEQSPDSASPPDAAAGRALTDDLSIVDVVGRIQALLNEEKR